MQPPRTQQKSPPNRPMGGTAVTPSGSSELDVLGGAIDPHLREVNLKIEKARAAGWNVIAPYPILEIAAGFRVALASVRVNSDVAAGDVYKQFGGNDDDDNSQKPGQRFAFRRNALTRIGDAYGLDWIWEHCKRVDDRSNQNIVEFQVAARFLDFSGRHVTRSATYQLDVEARCDEMRQNEWSRWDRKPASNRGTEDSQKRYIEGKLERHRLQLRSHIVPRAETGAIERLIRGLGLESGYTMDQLAHPFLVARVLFDPQDEVSRRLVYESALRSTSDLFGPSGQRHPAPPAPAADPPPEVIDKVPLAARPPAKAPAPEIPVELPAPDDDGDFASIDPAGQVATLELMMKRKGYPRSDLERVLKKKGYPERAISAEHPVEFLDPADRRRLYEKLRTMLAVQDDGGDDIPF